MGIDSNLPSTRKEKKVLEKKKRWSPLPVIEDAVDAAADWLKSAIRKPEKDDYKQAD